MFPEPMTFIYISSLTLAINWTEFAIIVGLCSHSCLQLAQGLREKNPRKKLLLYIYSYICSSFLCLGAEKSQRSESYSSTQKKKTHRRKLVHSLITYVWLTVVVQLK